jgi:hypothetical protein
MRVDTSQIIAKITYFSFIHNTITRMSERTMQEPIIAFRALGFKNISCSLN